ncbi:DUF1295 domain-containing protein [Stieleria marina]|uniref:DUF1295 domain-containing protein n=1 Tax=Stieleria marina TaxID=1930275 RepID=UPI003AF3800B
MDTWEILSATAAAIFVAVTILWLVSLWLKDASIADLFWGFGFVVIAAIAYAMGNQDLRGGLVAVLTAVWGLRLTGYLCWRNLGHGEDSRYRAMRDHHQERFWWVSFFTVFLLQGTIMWIVSLPVQVGQRSVQDLGPANFIGVAVWLVGFLFESIGDYQLARFKMDPANKGKVMDQGLWRYTRHPNYFGNALIWWGLTLLAMNLSTGWLLVSPVLMTFLLLKVSGVALLDKDLSNRSDEFRRYIARTSAFVPWPPS